MAKLDTQQQNIKCSFTKSGLNGNYVNINHQSLYFPLCRLKSSVICVTPPTSPSLSLFHALFLSPPPQTLQMGIQHFSGLFVLLCMGVGGALLTLAGEHTFYHLVIPRLRRSHTLQYWLHTSQVSKHKATPSFMLARHAMHLSTKSYAQTFKTHMISRAHQRHA